MSGRHSGLSEGRPRVRVSASPSTVFSMTYRTPDRTELLRSLIVRGQYIPGKTPWALANEWGCAPSTVRSMHTDVMRQLRNDQGHQEDVRQMVMATLLDIKAQALDATKTILDRDGCEHILPAPDYGAAVRAVTQYAKIAGLETTRVEIGRRDYDEMTREELLTLAASVVQQVATPERVTPDALTEGAIDTESTEATEDGEEAGETTH